MKDAANCDKQCELQNSVNHQDFERILRSREFLGACLAQRLFHLFCLFFSIFIYREKAAILCISESLKCVATDALKKHIFGAAESTHKYVISISWYMRLLVFLCAKTSMEQHLIDISILFFLLLLCDIFVRHKENRKCTYYNSEAWSVVGNNNFS